MTSVIDELLEDVEQTAVGLEECGPEVRLAVGVVKLRDTTDPESGERYTVKRYESEKAQDGELWRHEKITLKPLNPDFKPIVLTGGDEGELQVIAEFVEVLSNGGSSSRQS